MNYLCKAGVRIYIQSNTKNICARQEIIKTTICARQGIIQSISLCKAEGTFNIILGLYYVMNYNDYVSIDK